MPPRLSVRRPPRRLVPVLILVVTAAAAIGAPACDAGAQLTVVRNEGSAAAASDISGLPTLIDDHDFGPFGGAAVSEVARLGRARAAQTGWGLNAVTVFARLDDVSDFRFLALTELDVMVRNASATREPVIFTFTLNGGELRLFSGSRLFDGLLALVRVSIFINEGLAAPLAYSLWTWQAEFRGDAGVVTAHIDLLHDPLGLGARAVSPLSVTGDEAVLSIAPFTGVADLGPLISGDYRTVTYRMRADLTGPGIDRSGARQRWATRSTCRGSRARSSRSQG
jgi:hypothetical protein